MSENKIIDKLNKIIEKKGLKKKAVADRIGTSQKNFSNLLTGKRRLQSREIIPLCMALDISPNELFGYTKQGEVREEVRV